MPNTLHCGDCLELMKTMPDTSVDIIFCDPPYALGSEVFINSHGKPEYKRAMDFMDKWDQPDASFWEEWFKESSRILKFGGRIVMFGMDRQCWFNCYYANLAGFVQTQSLYWYFTQSMPKASDLSKNIDKHLGNESVLGAKYNGFKYSISPLKQTNETILIFQKPYKTGSCLHDVLKYEAGDEECCCGALDIEGGRVPIDPELDARDLRTTNLSVRNGSGGWGMNTTRAEVVQLIKETGRFPSQTFIDSGSGQILDNQYSDEGGCSRVLHKCEYDNDDFDLYQYCPKVSRSEREMGMSGFVDNRIAYSEFRENVESTKNYVNQYPDGTQRPMNTVKNNHPTVKPISLLYRILQLFKTPNPQVIFDPFCGSGSIPMDCELHDIGWIAAELNPDYAEIARARIKYATENKDSIRLKYTKPTHQSKVAPIPDIKPNVIEYF